MPSGPSDRGICRNGLSRRKSSALLQQVLTDAGFSIQKGVAGIPTAFMANTTMEVL